jgi:hypothetical protein
LKSPSGGANVIFTEVETLEIKVQETPKPLKRTFDENFIEDKCVVEERVSQAVSL